MQRQNIFTGIKVLPNINHYSVEKNNRQIQNQNDDLFTINQNQVFVKDKHNFSVFNFDCCIGKNSTQQEIYDNFCLTLVEDYVEGYDCTLIICGDNKIGNSQGDILLGNESEETKGILPRFIDHITNSIKYFSDRKFMFKVSFLQINNQQLIDLLGVKKCKLQIKQERKTKGPLFVSNLEIKILQKIDEIQSFYLVGNRKREYAYSKEYRNKENSTSLFTIYLQSLDEAGSVYRSSRFTFCQLAASSFEDFGNFRQGQIYQSVPLKVSSVSQGYKTSFQSKSTLNLSKYSFQNVVNTLVYGEQSVLVPFYDSKVTKILRQCLGGSQKAAILGTIQAQSKACLARTFKILKTVQMAGQIQNTPTNLRQIPCQQLNNNNESIIKCLQQIEKLSNELDRAKIDLQVLVNDSQYVPDYILKLKNQNGQSLLKDNQFCSQQNIEDHFFEEKTKKQEQLKQVIKKLQKNLKEKISFIQNLNHNYIQTVNNNPTISQQDDEEQIITKRKQILLRVKNIKQKRLQSIPNTDIQSISKQIKKQTFAMQIQFQKQRNLFTSTIRNLEQKLSFYKQVAQKYLKNQELTIIQANSKYDETKREFQIPIYMVRNINTKLGSRVSPMNSERKFLVSPKSKSFNSYHSIGSRENGKKFESNPKSNIDNILARRPNKQSDYNSQYQINSSNAKSNSINRGDYLTGKHTKRTGPINFRQFKSPIKFKRIKGNHQHSKNVRTQYQIQQVDENTHSKHSCQRQKLKTLQAKRNQSRQSNQANPTIQMKKQKLYTKPYSINPLQAKEQKQTNSKSPNLYFSVKSQSKQLPE